MYEVANIRFYPIVKPWDNKTITQYFIKGDVHGSIYMDDIRSEAEILRDYPEAKKYTMAFGSNEWVNH